MLHQIDPSAKVINETSRLFKLLKINQLLRLANIKKSRGVSVKQVFEFIFTLALHGKNQYRFLESKRGQRLPRKDVYYNFLNNPHYAWRLFMLMLASKVTDASDHLTRGSELLSLTTHLLHEIAAKRDNFWLEYLIIASGLTP